MLRRVATNVVDLYTAEGEYLRAFEDRGSASHLRVKQIGSDRLAVEVYSAADDHARVAKLAASILGIERDVSEFEKAATRVDWLAPLVDRFRGVRPPRYPSLWEAFVNAVVFQQVSLQSASAIVRRLIMALAEPREIGAGQSSYAFPGVDRFQRTDDAELRGAGLSAGKLRTLRAAAGGLLSGPVSEEWLSELPSAGASAELQRIPGIGPWTAAVILLRGLGRLDVFPPNDSGVAANLRRITGVPAVELSNLLDELGRERGMLYYYLLLSRLDRQGRLGEPSVAS